MCVAASAQAAPDAKLLAAAEKAQPSVIDNLKEMVLIESGSLNVDGLQKMAGVIEGQLKGIGFKTERRKATAGAGADIVVGTLKGTGKRKIMLQAHMDTVYAQGILGTQPYKVDGNRIYGPGIADDKGGIAVMLASLKILADAGLARLRHAHRAVQPRRRSGFGRFRRTHRHAGGAARYGAVLRADRGEVGSEG